MKQCNQFKLLFNAVKKYSNDVRQHTECFVNGTIKGYRFRLFQELVNNKYEAFLCINDKIKTDGTWRALYNSIEVDIWFAERKLLSCPFCGGNATILPSWLSNHWFYPTCKGEIKEDCPGIVEEQDEQGGSNCDCKTIEKAVELWNKRA